MERIKAPIIASVLLLLAFAVYYQFVTQMIQSQKLKAEENTQIAAKLATLVPTLQQMRRAKPTHVHAKEPILSYLEKSMTNLKYKNYPHTLRQLRENSVELILPEALFSDWLIWLKTIAHDDIVHIDKVDIQAGKDPDTVQIQMQISQ